ncbi:MAG: type II and III secretion system protein, partial [Desulfobacterales bacterium]|nr:type II and III secretion system protein [Desulfobacterales bacterium]
KLDVPVPQVFLEVRVEELSTTALDKIGVQQGSYAKLRLLSDAQGLITDIALDLPSIVEALKQDGIARTLANPSLVTLDGQTSKLLIGDKIPVESQELVNGEMTTVITYIQAGIQLEFTPRISADNYITLNIKPQISSLGEYLTKGYPLIRSRELETVVRIKDGETFVIGGLIREDDRQSLEKVPILGDIPILGALFKHTEDSKQATDIIIFITPKIIYPGDENYFNSEQDPIINVDDPILNDVKLEKVDSPSDEPPTFKID